MEKPQLKPDRPFFSSGPCVKIPGYNLSMLQGAILGRSHRSDEGKEKLQRVITETREILAIPEDYYIGIVAGSDTGAFSMAMWNFLGARKVTVLAWDVFGKEWLYDIENELKVNYEARIADKPGTLPDLSEINPENDILFTWHGTTSGLWVPDGEWISKERKGLTICDAVSAVFVTRLPWNKLDVTTFAWQKGLGGEAAHGMIVLSPKAIERLKEFTPDRALPKIFRLKKKDGELNLGFFQGNTLNTPSLLCVEDCLVSLAWMKEIGGIEGAVKRAKQNLEVIKNWLQGKESWISLSCEDTNNQSFAVVCLKITEKKIASLPLEKQWEFIRRMTKEIVQENAGYDLNGHIHDYPYIRIWIGPTVDSVDLERLLPWIEWAYYLKLDEK